MKIFPRRSAEPTPDAGYRNDCPIWDALLAEHGLAGDPDVLLASIEVGLRPETRAWLRRHGAGLHDDDVPAPSAS